MRILITCPPMLGMIDSFRPIFEEKGFKITIPEVVQTLTIDELISILPNHDGWIIGDDPATREVFEAGAQGRLKAAVKWGIGVDNVDIESCNDLAIPFTNTPNMFGSEVADMAVGYVIALARETFQIDQAIRKGDWPKPRGISLLSKTVALIGYGDIGKNTANRLKAMGMKVHVYDPVAGASNESDLIEVLVWPERLEEADFIVITCALNDSSYHMVNDKILTMAKTGVRIVNISRGPIIDEGALIAALESEKVYSAALDVFENEPLPMNSGLRSHPRCIFGSHNASNTIDAVERTSLLAIKRLFSYLERGQ
ncbi:MAG: phosphoglycerate dehydrogenase [Gammaproteobacteria bacterium]|nr:phosphoglycerate dehydrogenase [Gammaproteobacteria bacterium]